jgi:hypothetical protein
MNNDYARFLCGNASAFVATSFVHPMDVIKISKQLNMKPTYNISNLYRGYTVGLLRQSTYSSPNIFIFTQLMNNYKTKNDNNDPGFLRKLLYGSVSGTISGFTGNPSEVVMVRTIQPDKPKQGFIKHTTDVYNRHGIGGFFNGYKAAISRSLVYNGTRLSLYSHFKGILLNHYPSLENTTTLHFMTGAISTTIAIIVSNPIDVIKARAQKSDSANVTEIIKSAYKNERFSFLYRGLLPSISKSLPHSIISFVVLEKMMILITGKDAI